MSQPPVFYKNPAISVILSFFFMGLGQLYNGQVGKGVGFIVLYSVSILLMFIFIGFITTPILWIAGMLDAHRSALAINTQLAEEATGKSAPAAPAASTSKKCPQCAEDVNAEAVVCRFCGHRFESPTTAAPQAQVAPQPPRAAPAPPLTPPKDGSSFFQRPPAPPTS